MTVYDPDVARATNTTLEHLRGLEGLNRTEESLLAT
jgi:hypothetical protein